ncbi:MAG: hypothetical protein HQL88_09980 [Magnetococcales bacterium]|nr:hypothetical protein [Magnetococcales bacterium]
MDISRELGLPNFLKSNLLPLELNYYGAAKLVADKLGIQDPPVSHVSWAHGWIPDDVTLASRLAGDGIIGVVGQPEATITIPMEKRRPFLVSTKAFETLLRESGLTDSKAVGLPFSYVEPDPAARRIPGSLLVMPAHVLIDQRDGRTDEITYLEYIKSIAHQFSRVVFCINLGCVGSGLWIGNLEKYGFDYVWGAGMMDQMALIRMRKIFDSFEYMTSNGIGSHFVYSGLCGVKVSMAGPLDNVPLDMHKTLPAWQNPKERERLILACTMVQHGFLKKKFPWLYREPRDGVECVEWAREEIGFYNRVPFEELARLFGWIAQPANRPESFFETVSRLDASDNIAEFVQFVQSASCHPQEMLLATTQLLARARLRSAYILAMLLDKRGHRGAVISLAHSVGGLLFNPVEMANGLAQLPDRVDALSGEQQNALHNQLVIPVLSPLLSTALEQGDDLRIHHLLILAKAAVPRFRDLEAAASAEVADRAEHSQHNRQQAQQILQAWQKA